MTNNSIIGCSQTDKLGLRCKDNGVLLTHEASSLKNGKIAPGYGLAGKRRPCSSRFSGTNLKSAGTTIFTQKGQCACNTLDSSHPVGRQYVILHDRLPGLQWAQTRNEHVLNDTMIRARLCLHMKAARHSNCPSKLDKAKLKFTAQENLRLGIGYIAFIILFASSSSIDSSQRETSTPPLQK